MKYLKITEMNEVFMCESTETPYLLGERVRDSLIQYVSTKTPALFDLSDATNGSFGASQLVTIGTARMLQMDVKAIQFNVAMKMVDGFITPDWRPNPACQMNVLWKVPDGLSIVLGVMVTGNRLCSPADHYMITKYTMGDCHYRLPLGNLHADCKLCHGQEYHGNYSSLHALALDVTSRFISSPWNSDLLQPNDDLASSRVFRWKSEGGQLIQQPAPSFAGLLEVVSTTITQTYFP